MYVVLESHVDQLTLNDLVGRLISQAIKCLACYQSRVSKGSWGHVTHSAPYTVGCFEVRCTSSMHDQLFN